MLKETRRKQILELLKRDGEVEIGTLCRLFNVADMTIRRDLNQLAQEINIQRTHGGAMLIQEDQIAEPSYERRIKDVNDCKEEIAKRALTFLKNGYKIFLDSGSTTYKLALLMPNSARNVVVTNGINIASELIERSNISVVMIGGDLRKNTLATRGPIAQDMLSQFRVDVAFIGANAIDENGEAYVGNTHEIGIKSVAIENAKSVYILADHTKLGTTNLIRYVNVGNISGIITDSHVDSSIVENFLAKGINIIVASPCGD